MSDTVETKYGVFNVEDRGKTQNFSVSSFSDTFSLFLLFPLLYLTSFLLDVSENSRRSSFVNCHTVKMDIHRN